MYKEAYESKLAIFGLLSIEFSSQPIYGYA